ncbi:MAG TPA: DUF3014 domain-containing protein [Myxococcales bacterium]|nr:DUF3014 domain-containing protein [Myxococcales bacterium]
MDDPGSPKQKRGAVLAAAAVLVLALGAAAFLWLRTPAPAPVPPPPPAPAPAQTPAPDAPLPAAEESDARVRRLFGPLSGKQLWTHWLAEAGLLERAAVLIDNLVEDVSPRKQLLFLAPREPFAASSRGGKWFIDPRSYQRYDGIGEVAASLDAQGFARGYRELHGLLETAYHALGYPDRLLDPVMTLALKRLAKAPVAEGEVELRKDGRIYRFADEKLEEQGPIEKHLLRMGPRNTRAIAAKAREIADAVGMPVQ